MGSIGQRHLRNIKLLRKKYRIYALRKKKKSPHLDIDNNVIDKKFLSYENNITEISEKESLKIQFHAVFICNPSSMHIKSSITHARNGSNLFIEKPLSNNMRHVEKLRGLIKQKKIKCAVGYQLRYHPFLKKIKKYIDSKKLGEIKEAYIRNSHYLPYHHRYEDYSKGYAAINSLGGGVILCFIHEIDYANYLFNIPKSVSCMGGKKSNLKIDVEDFAKLKVIYKLKNNQFPVYIHLDFLEKKEKRNCKIIFEKGILYWDLKKDFLTVHKNKKIYKRIKSPFKKRNDLFLKEIKEVMKNFEKKLEPISNIENGVSSLVLALAAKRSLKFKKKIKL